jgi:predicted PurR-regulated permease PerM
MLSTAALTAEETKTPAAAPSDARVVGALVSGAVVVAALYYGQELLIPLALATLLAFVLAPACRWLQRARLPRVAAVLLAVGLAFAAIGALGTVVAHQAASLGTQIPEYEAVMLHKWHGLTQGPGLVPHLIGGVLPGAATARPGHPAAEMIGPVGNSALSVARSLAQPVLGSLATAGVVLVFTIFILLYDEDLRDRMVRLVGRRDLHRTIFAMNDAAGRLSRYFLFQLVLNGSFGLLIGASLTVAGLPGAVLWGILAAMMRFVPFIGTFVALAPPLILAIAVSPGWTLAIVVLLLFVVSELIMGQVIEPLIYGHSTGLSPIAVIVATAFWALLWGPVGLLLATPLTVCLVVVGRHVEQLSFFDVLFGDTPPLTPDETFYQRALEGKADVLLVSAKRHIAANSISDYYDRVALSGLALAQGDRARDSLAFERLESVHAQIETLLAGLKTETAARVDQAPAPPPAWQAPGCILCVPGRGQLDGLAAEMAVQVLGFAGFGAGILPNLSLGTDEAPPAEAVRMCCLSVLEEGSSVSAIRYFLKRMRKAMPDAILVVGLWHADGTSPLLAELRAAGDDEHLVLSIGELLAFARAVAAQRESALV